MSLQQAAARYLQVKHFILEQIAGGALRAGERVPSENELTRTLTVSRMTANRALRELAADGVLVRVAGVGTFVAEQRVHAHPLEVRNIADEVRARGHEYRAKLIALDSVSATRELAERCGVKPGSSLDYSLLTHFEDGTPLQVEERYVNPQVAPGYLRNDFSRTTPHEFLMRVAPLQRAEHTVRAVVPERRIRRLLKLEPGEACLLILRRTFSNGRIASVVDLYHPGSRYELAATCQPRSA
ncbi:MAG TPA: histidine utilization repressor [Steroidobacteraceae bacterium]|jgi:GntR family histidine utilization transcriptional repressor|nr:histidine utilization repressor [Steroidobacteraceae bacterium]